MQSMEIQSRHTELNPQQSDTSTNAMTKSIRFNDMKINEGEKSQTVN